MRAVVGAVARRALPKSALERAAVPVAVAVVVAVAVAVAVAVVVAGCFRLATPVLVVGRQLS